MQGGAGRRTGLSARRARRTKSRGYSRPRQTMADQSILKSAVLPASPMPLFRRKWTDPTHLKLGSPGPSSALPWTILATQRSPAATHKTILLWFLTSPSYMWCSLPSCWWGKGIWQTMVGGRLLTWRYLSRVSKVGGPMRRSRGR